ncbi:hypothetical protein FC17_GL001915 [Secundilactobacillus paracollinoides DSM 15502 = JCM 11969]|nr:hypothetical protein FC17_GL001915 [Secundilactobacillus paracollinoides DSM 15502 = JCM 11969]
METVALNLANMLQTAIQRRNQLLYENDIALSSEETMRGNYVRLDVALADLANTMGWFELTDKPIQANHDDLLATYLKAMDGFFQVAAKQTWSQLIVQSDDKLAALKATKKAKSLSQQYLAMKQLVFDAFLKHEQPAFEHAWHLFLKLGLVDLEFTEDELEKAFLAEK